MAQNHVWRYTLRLFHTFANFEKIEKSMQKGMPNVVIVDAERHRRTPRLSAISGKAIRAWAGGFFGAVADSMRDAGRNLATLPLQCYQMSEQKN